MPPKLFITVLEYVFKMLNWDTNGITNGITIDGEKVNHLCFAGDVILITDDLSEMEIMLKELSVVCDQL